MKCIAAMILCMMLAVPARAMDFSAPDAPEQAESFMPSDPTSFATGLTELLGRTVSALDPQLKQACRIGIALTAAAMILSVVQAVSAAGKTVTNLAGTAVVAAILLSTTGSMIHLGAATVASISDYGKLLIPVMASALAAQGGVTSAPVLYAGTALFNSLLITAMEKLILPGIWLYLAFSIASLATGEDLLKKFADLVKGLISWGLKLLLMVFTTYLGISGVVSGTTDAVTLKAARVTMSSFVPVVGGILSDASEAVLVSAQLMKNTAGVYGIFAVLAIFLHPFLKIGVHYLILRLTAAVCSVFTSKELSELMDRITTAMALVLGMTAAGCVMTLVSTICFMKGVSG